MKDIRTLALTTYYPYGKFKDNIKAEREALVDKALAEHDNEIKGSIIRDVLETVKVENEKYLDECYKRIKADAIDEFFENIKKYCKTSSCIGCRFCDDETCEIARIKEMLKVQNDR